MIFEELYRDPNRKRVKLDGDVKRAVKDLLSNRFANCSVKDEEQKYIDTNEECTQHQRKQNDQRPVQVTVLGEMQKMRPKRFKKLLEANQEIKQKMEETMTKGYNTQTDSNNDTESIQLLFGEEDKASNISQSQNITSVMGISSIEETDEYSEIGSEGEIILDDSTHNFSRTPQVED